PVAATFAQRGQVTIECSACGTRDTHDAPATALERCSELAGVVAPEHAVGYQAPAPVPDRPGEPARALHPLWIAFTAPSSTRLAAGAKTDA
ncbi:MAG: hypothetical protein ACRELB_04870, partial [Polyangiaceae bacterium]